MLAHRGQPAGKSGVLATSSSISAVIVPHHDVVKEQRAVLFQQIKALVNPPTIILVSPNHYEVGHANIQTTAQTWRVTAGEIKPNTAVITRLIGQVAGDEPGSFANEHGIKLILGNLKETFPGATIVPLILKRGTSMAKVMALHDALKVHCAGCLMVSSVDFSHYQPALLADLHDDLTLRALQGLDAETLMAKAEVDSPAALALATKWAASHQTPKFHLAGHTNSGVLAGSPDIETTSHVFGWYETGEPIEPEKSVSFTIGGDMMFGRYIAHKFLPKLTTSVELLGERLFWGTDAGIVNLEGPISDQPVPDDIRPNNLIFNFPPQAIPALKFMKVNAASQANNHSANAGSKGLETTRALLAQAGIQPCGGPDDGGISRVAKFVGQGLTLYVIGVHTLSSEPDLGPLIREIKQDATSRVIIFPHWGSEYVLNDHTGRQAAEARAWIDAGADLVIGAHPHVIEDMEVYRGKPIIYSVGNLLFDQAFSQATQQGLIISGKFTTSGLTLFALPIQSRDYRPVVMRGQPKQTIISKLYQPVQTFLHQSISGAKLFFPN
jgi:AmmeMemoRadiSam system protein B